MSVSTFAAVALLAGAPMDPGATPPEAPMAEVVSAAGDQAPPVELATPVAPSEPPALPTPASTADEIVVTAQPKAPPGDPLQQVNIKSFEAIDTVDKAVVGPVARAYKDSVPNPIRSGLRNFLGNLAEPVASLNFLLQLKPGKAAETLGRFTINSTIGVAGLLDVAKKRPFKLPRRPNGFANTMGYYGVKPGPYFYLPLVGPTTLRDLTGNWIDNLVLPVAVGKPFNEPAYVVSTYVVGSIDERAEFDEQRKKLRAGPTSPYAATREYYLQTRQAEIDALHGRHDDAAKPAVDPAAPPPVAPVTPQG